MSESELCTTSQWVRFFCNAGLPSNVAANYAIIFSDNRIQQNMLMDLSKEYLYDMGIKVMGDVIAILKYAKEFHNQIVKEKIIGNTDNRTSPLNRSSPATRILGHYTRSAAPIKQSVGNTLQRVQPPIVRKRISLTVPDEKPVKKVRRVLPEEEGGYTIKMPAGTTERTRKIMEQQQVAVSSKKSVFDRLGDSHVSSSTDVNKNVASVFKRLGPSSAEVSTSTAIKTREAPLSYRGVLKTLKAEKKTITSVKQPQSTTIRVSNVSRSVPVSQRLGTKPTTQSKRIVISHNFQNTGVNQINSILKKSASSFGPTRQVLNVKKVSIAPLKKPALNTITLKSRLSKPKPTVLRTSHADTRKISVFKRLG